MTPQEQYLMLNHLKETVEKIKNIYDKLGVLIYNSSLLIKEFEKEKQ